jgi:hypothetical protein
MAQAARDPVFHAALAIAEQDASFSGDTCLRCHAPRAWMEGRSEPTDGAALTGTDFEGVTCIICHRMIDPIYEAGVSPADDVAELAFVTSEFGPVVTDPHNGAYIIDTLDRRRGPLDLDLDYDNFDLHAWRQSPFHRESALCATCHEVSNPVVTRDQIGGPNSASDTYSLNASGAVHENFNKRDMFPEQRTYSEWLMSDFADGPIDMGGRFGGDNPLVSTCQDCHMPDELGQACNPAFLPPNRPDMPLHYFLGASNWVLDAILDLDQTLELYDLASGLSQADVDAAKARNLAFLQAAADMELDLTQDDQLNVRIVNQTGHKLPTGYPEGRRMWLNVKYRDSARQLLLEHGAYDPDTADLDESGTKVYETHMGIDQEVADATGLSAGQTSHLTLNNVLLLDNRIPPRGFTNAELESVQAAPVAYSYADGQHWDDTVFDVPCTAATAEVTLYYQSARRQYIEFLRDANVTDTRGQLVYDLWAANGKSSPLSMINQTLDLPDCNHNGRFDACDLADMTSDDVNDNGIPDECECSAFSQCADMDDNGVRDDPCLWWACQSGLCAATSIPFGDMGGFSGSCPPDGTADANDRFHALNCFSNQDTTGIPGQDYPCEASPPAAFNVDPGGPFGSCLPDGVCDGNDAFHAINSFTGVSTCSCPGGPSPSAPAGPVVTGKASLALRTAERSVRPGGTLLVDVFIEGGLADLRGYQLHLGVSGGERGSLEVVDILVAGRRDEVFSGHADWQAFNVDTGQMVAGLDGPGRPVPGHGGYLATYVYRASADAAGSFTIDVLSDDIRGAGRTYLFPSLTNGKIGIAGTSAAVVNVAGKSAAKPRLRDPAVRKERS